MAGASNGTSVHDALDALAASVRAGTASAWQVELVRSRYTLETLQRAAEREPRPLEVAMRDDVTLMTWQEFIVRRGKPFGSTLQLFLDGREITGVGGFTVSGEAGKLPVIELRGPR